MSKHAKRHQIPEATQGDAMRIARATQRPGQTKEQTKLITQGIQKGIEQYKNQQNAKARELDKKFKKANRQVTRADASEIKVHKEIIYKQHWLPWVLLMLTWLAIAAYWFTTR